MHPILVIRHAEQEDVSHDMAPLSQYGLQQAKALREKIVLFFSLNQKKAKITGITSCTSRSYHTALYAIGFYDTKETPIAIPWVDFSLSPDLSDNLAKDIEEGLKELVDISIEPKNFLGKTKDLVVVVAHSDTIFNIVKRIAQALSLSFNPSKQEEIGYCEGFLLSDSKVEKWPNPK